MSKKLSIVNQKAAKAETAPEPDRVDLRVSERIALATILGQRERLQNELTALQEQANALTSEIFERAGISKDSKTPYKLSLEGLVKQ